MILLVVLIVAICFNQGICQLICRDGQVRLDENNRLWACSKGQWGTVCSSDFDASDAIVACRNLGYGTEESGISYTTIDGASGFIALGSLACDGSEEYIADCVGSFDFLNTCDHSMDIALECPSLLCSDGNLRLVNGFSSNEGTLEICKNGSWNTICKDGFGGQEAYVACRQMGLNASTAEVLDIAFSTGHGWAEYTKFLCTGKETNLTQCSYSLSESCLSYDPYTGHVAVAQLVCSGDPAPESCVGLGIRINNNGEILGKGSGRLELCQSGAWGTVNNNMFSVKDSLVACRQLDIHSPSTQVYPQGYFTNNAAGPIILRDLVCLGSESSLYSAADPPPGCSNGESTVDFDHTTDVFLNCWSKVGVTCNIGDVRLANGSNKDEGRVEICLGDQWGTMCDKFWDRKEAKVICNQLGYPNSYGAFYTESKFGTGEQVPYFYTDFNCTGSENGIVSCPKSDQIEGEKCLFGKAVGVKCYNNTGCTNGSVRLVGAGSDNEGDVQICRDGVWGYICDENWTENDAHVVCRDQGYSDDWYGRSTLSLFGGSQDTAPIVYDSMNCAGTEERLSDCTASEYASLYPTCRSVAGVTCLKEDQCSNGDVRLEGGSSEYEGRLEICTTYGSWTTVKSSQITYLDAQVICKQLGYDAGWSSATPGNTWGTGNRMIYYDEVNCAGTESKISDCAKTTISINANANGWYNYERAGVSCEDRELAESCDDEGAVRLKDGVKSSEGRLEICMNNYWGSVCKRDWTQQNGLVACRQAGYETLRPLLSSASFSTRINGPVNVEGVQCGGHESKLTDCVWSEAIGTSSCYHGEDVGLICSELPDVYSIITIGSSVEEPLPLGSEVTLTSEGAPQTDGIFYSWSMDNIDMSTSTSSVTFTVGLDFPKSFQMYCNVYRTNEKVAVGVRKFKVEDLLTASQSVVTANVGDDITLTFNRRDTRVNQYLRDLTWTLQGNGIDTQLSRYTVGDGGLSLSIDGIALTDYGIYSLQYNGLDLQAYNSFCERTTMSYLRDYPVLSPGYIVLTASSDDGLNPENLNHLLVQDYEKHNYTLGGSSLVVSARQSGTIPSETIVQPEWYFNGAQYLETSVLTLRDHNPVYNYVLSNPVLFDSGYYELVLKFPFEDIMRNLGCSREYGSRYLEFLQNDEFLSFENNYIVLDTATIEVRYNEKPTAQLTTDKLSFDISDNATLSCMGNGGYPRYYTITLWKSGNLLANVTGPMLEFQTADVISGSKYGVYRCSVDNTVIDDSTSITISNQANISIIFASGDCDNWDSEDIEEIEEGAVARLKDACDCTLDGATVMNSVLSCPTGQSVATFNTTLVYTNSDGSLLAYHVVNSTLNEFNNRINRTLLIAGVSYKILMGPSDPEENFELSQNAIIGLMFAGGFLAASILFILVIIFIVVRLRRHSNEESTGNQQVHFRNENEKVNIDEDDIDEKDFQPLPPPEDDDELDD